MIENGFSYNSNTNKDFLSIPEIKAHNKTFRWNLFLHSFQAPIKINIFQN